jgi:acyl-CoA hydrolase
VVVFVALDAEGRPAAVPPWRPETELDRALDGYAERLAVLRRQMDAEMDARLGALAATGAALP